MLLAATISNAIINISLLALPQPPKLRLPLRQKLAVSGIFALGTLYAQSLLLIISIETPLIHQPQRLRHQHNPHSPLHPRQLKLRHHIHQSLLNFHLDLPRIRPRSHNNQSPHSPPPLPLPLPHRNPKQTHPHNPNQTASTPTRLPRQRSLAPNKAPRRRHSINHGTRNAWREFEYGSEFRNGRTGNEAGNHGAEAYELS